MPPPNVAGDCLFGGVVREHGSTFPHPDGCNTWYVAIVLALNTPYNDPFPSASVQMVQLDALRYSVLLVNGPNLNMGPMREIISFNSF